MSTIVIYGASDDLIEVGGAVELEGNGWNAVDEPVTVDGVVVATVTWADDADGTWRITPNVQMLTELGLEWVHGKAPGEDVGDVVVAVDGYMVEVRGYSDHLIIRGAFRAVEVGGDSGTVKS